MNNLAKRTISAAILAPLVLWIIWLGGWAFYTMVILAGIIMYKEWLTITKTSENLLLWKFWGLIYTWVPCLSLIIVRSIQEGHLLIIGLLVIVWATDIGAYFAGKAIGGPKLAPKISPKKTWSGAVGGVFFSVLAVYLFTFFLESSQYFTERLLIMVIITVVFSIISQIGDLFESWVKRKFGVKDSGNLIPGHGGLLDRLDGLLFVLLAVGIFLFAYTFFDALLFVVPAMILLALFWWLSHKI